MFGHFLARVRLPLASAALMLAASVCTVFPVHAASQTRAVQFAPGSNSTTLTGSIKGYDFVDYTLRAAPGQQMKVSMKAGDESTFFNVLPPGSRETAIHIGSVNGNDWTATLERGGEYTVRVYQMRNEARRGTRASYTLNVGITGKPDAPMADAKVPGTAFHATGQLPCTMGNCTPTICSFGVIRGGPGQAEVRITTPTGLERTLMFSGNQVRSPGSQSIRTSRQGDEWNIEVNDFERFQVPDAVINGG